MNDNDTVAAVRDSLVTAKDSLAGVHMDTPLDAIARSGRARRRWHRLTGVTAAMAVLAGAALAVTMLAPSGQSPSPSGRVASHPPAARLAAWTVDRQANGDIKVTVRQLSDPSGLQSTLRADGVPASVTFSRQQNPACQPYPGGTPQHLLQPATALLKAVFPKPYNDLPVVKQPRVAQRVPAGSIRPALPTLNPNHVLIVIDPSALPGNAGVQLGSNYSGTAFLLPQVVYASAQCTGS